MAQTPHKIVNPLSLAEPVGYAHALVADAGRTVFVGAQTARRSSGPVVGDTVVQQFDQALANLVEALRAVGAQPSHVVEMRIQTTAMNSYRANLESLGAVYRRHMGRHYPAMSAAGVGELLERDALIALTCTAVVPENRRTEERGQEHGARESSVGGAPAAERART